MTPGPTWRPPRSVRRDDAQIRQPLAHIPARIAGGLVGRSVVDDHPERRRHRLQCHAVERAAQILRLVPAGRHQQIAPRTFPHREVRRCAVRLGSAKSGSCFINGHHLDELCAGFGLRCPLSGQRGLFSGAMKRVEQVSCRMRASAAALRVNVKPSFSWMRKHSDVIRGDEAEAGRCPASSRAAGVQPHAMRRVRRYPFPQPR